MGEYRLATLCFLLSCGTAIKPPYFRHSSSQLGHAPLLSSHAPLPSSHAFSRDVSHNGTQRYNLFRHVTFWRSPKRHESDQHAEQHDPAGNIAQEQHTKEHNITRVKLAGKHTAQEQHNTERGLTHEQHEEEPNMNTTEHSRNNMAQGRQHEAHNMAEIQHHEGSSSMTRHDYDGQLTLGSFDLRAVRSRVKLGHDVLEKEEEEEEEGDTGAALTSQEWDDVIRGNFLVIDSPDRSPDPLQEEQLFEGDIEVASEDQLIQEFMATNRNAATSLRRRWPNATVPYEISSALPRAARLAIGAALLQLHSNTCIRLVPRDRQRDHVLFRASSVCSSSIGRQGSRQVVRLSPRCYTPGIVVHELMHALGFWHEQARADRDDHVTVLWDNVLKNMKHNFARKRATSVQDFGAAYDYDSVMHYSWNHFASDPSRPTLVPTVPGVRIGQRIGLSATDVYKLNALYGCLSSPPFSEAPSAAGCEDRDARCGRWAGRGECQRNSAWMHVVCRRACAVCDDPCIDDHIFCAFWAEAGECTTNRSFMLRFCKQSCLACLPAGYDPQCLDQSKHCKFWANSGQCVSNPRYMLENCKKSCKQC